MTKHTQAKVGTTENPKPAIVIRGLPGIGKTTLANAVAASLQAYGVASFQINADAVRGSVSKDLGFSLEHRVENARRIGALSFLASQNGYVPVIDFVMPNKMTFDEFATACGTTHFHLWSLNPSSEFRSRYPDTVNMFERLQEWWGGAVYDYLYEQKPFAEADVNEVAAKIVSVYLRTNKPTN
jgi:adenylylsulfate kinase-like enzyme